MESDTESELANVVMFPVKEEDPLDIAGYIHEHGEWCYHLSIFVNEHDRQCRCQKCGATIEPFDYLLDLAKRRTRMAGDVKALRVEERRRRENIEKLIQIERNAKARIRRLNKKQSIE
ncbi:hypothetical protein PVP21_003877 [Salmonella enterica]|nr:hypothetical protein [Salmonella enterica]EKM4843298.1 hypothetical protein [Salmonella enterica]EKM8420164.1 hypothetical protein [Salmonella enterica]